MKLIRSKIVFFIVAVFSGALTSAIFLFISRRLDTERNEKFKYRACLQYEAVPKWIADCDSGDDGEPCPEWAIEIISEKPIAPCSGEL